MVEYTRNVGCSVREVTMQDVYETYLLRSNYEILAHRKHIMIRNRLTDLLYIPGLADVDQFSVDGILTADNRLLIRIARVTTEYLAVFQIRPDI